MSSGLEDHMRTNMALYRVMVLRSNDALFCLSTGPRFGFVTSKMKTAPVKGGELCIEFNQSRELSTKPGPYSRSRDDTQGASFMVLNACDFYTAPVHIEA